MGAPVSDDGDSKSKPRINLWRDKTRSAAVALPGLPTRHVVTGGLSPPGELGARYQACGKSVSPGGGRGLFGPGTWRGRLRCDT